MRGVPVPAEIVHAQIVTPAGTSQRRVTAPILVAGVIWQAAVARGPLQDPEKTRKSPKKLTEA